MILLNVVLETPLFILMFVSTSVAFFVAGCIWMSSLPREKKIKKKCVVIDIDQSLTESISYAWRPETAN